MIDIYYAEDDDNISQTLKEFIKNTGELELKKFPNCIAYIRDGGRTCCQCLKAQRKLLGQTYETEIENRIQDKLNNDNMFRGMKMIVSIFCVLFAIIGIGNVFFNTLGFVRLRRREFARYLSVDLTLQGMRKIFFVEALVIAGRPVLITLPITVAAVILFIKASYLEPMIVIRETPFIPILAFILAIFAFVGLAYYLGARKVLGNDLINALRDDTVM